MRCNWRSEGGHIGSPFAGYPCFSDEHVVHLRKSEQSMVCLYRLAYDANSLFSKLKIMLSEDRKSIIEAEERFRHEIKLKLESEFAKSESSIQNLEESAKDLEKKVSSKVMDFLNSSLGMLLISSVVISGGGALYQQAQHHYAVEQKNKEQLVAYQFEIGDRIQNMRYLLRHSKTVGDAKTALASIFKSKFPLNSDLDNKSLSALYFNLYQLIQGSQKTKSKEAMEIVRDLEDAEYSLQSKDSNSQLNAEEKEKLSKLILSIEKLHLDTSSN